MKEIIFVFGSNLAGRHGAGAALYARKYRGAIYGQAFGMQGASFGIPTKDEKLKTLPIHRIKPHVDLFIAYAMIHPELTFQLTAVGCGLAGYAPEDMGPLFNDAPPNVEQPPEFTALRKKAK